MEFLCILTIWPPWFWLKITLKKLEFSRILIIWAHLFPLKIIYWKKMEFLFILTIWTRAFWGKITFEKNGIFKDFNDMATRISA